MTFGDVLVHDEHGNTIGRIDYGRDGWDWHCGGWDWHCGGCAGRSSDEGYRSASAALADFESHVERRHP